MKRKKNKRKLKKSILVLVEGESEKIYLNSFKSSNIHLKPELPKKSLQELYQYFKENVDKYDEIFWIVDLDVVIREGILNKFRDYKKNYPDKIIINNPCFEFWFVLHYELKNFDDKCEKVISYLKHNFDEFKTYDKSEKEIEKIVKLLNGKLENAINNSKKRVCDFEYLMSCSEMFMLIERLQNDN